MTKERMRPVKIGALASLLVVFAGAGCSRRVEFEKHDDVGTKIDILIERSAKPMLKRGACWDAIDSLGFLRGGTLDSELMSMLKDMVGTRFLETSWSRSRYSFDTLNIYEYIKGDTAHVIAFDTLGRCYYLHEKYAYWMRVAVDERALLPDKIDTTNFDSEIPQVGQTVNAWISRHYKMQPLSKMLSDSAIRASDALAKRLAARDSTCCKR